MADKEIKPRLWTRDFILVFISNLMLFGSFYMLLPILPFYLTEDLGTSQSVAGVVIALYTISALAIRPFSGFMVDKFARKPLYLICYAIFAAVFAGYAVAVTLTIFIMMRIIHGFAFGMSSVSGNTIAVDIMPRTRQGEGIGFFGMATSVAMALGPFVGLGLYGKVSFKVIFLCAFAAALAGLITIMLIKPVQKPGTETAGKKKKTVNDFILTNALLCAIPFLFLGFAYGALSNYIGVYSEQTAAVKSVGGIFFLIFAAGILAARFVSGKALNKGHVVPVIYIGSILLLATFVLFAIDMNKFIFLTIAVLAGIGYGFIMPAFQEMFINLATDDHRGVANATYFTFWDLGIGIGIAVAGFLIQKFGFLRLFLLCAGLIGLGIIIFRLY
ncbi:MAG: MFS transporter, partial [Rikenellaceae bacterium]|nr:MFS transporter [Rikenellaceae bacterium]